MFESPEVLVPRAQVDRVYAAGHSPLGPPLLAEYGSTFSRATWIDWAIMGGVGVIFIALAWWVLARRGRLARR